MHIMACDHLVWDIDVHVHPCTLFMKWFPFAGDSGASDEGVEEEVAGYGCENNPFSLLYQPPSKFSLLSVEDIPQSSTESSLTLRGFADYLKKLQSGRICENELTLSLLKEQPVSNQTTQYDISGIKWLLVHCISCSFLTWTYIRLYLCD